MNLLRYIVLLFLCASCQEQKMNYSDTCEFEWSFKQVGDSIWMSATVPGVAHLDLLDNGVIPDPFRDNNEKALAYLDTMDWVYRSTFLKKDLPSGHEHLSLVFEGLDSYASIRLNDRKVMQTENMFRSYEIQLDQDELKELNTLEIKFTSPINFNKEKLANASYALPSGNESDDTPIKVASYTRKAAYQFGWDWGPRFVSSGIWRPVRWEAWTGARIKEHWVTTQRLNEKLAQLTLTVELEVDRKGEYQLISDHFEWQGQLEPGLQRINIETRIKDPIMWWPNGKGDAYLYEDELLLLSGKDSLERSDNRFAIRSIELINQEDHIGTSFYFKFNGKEVFMKGANYIPQDIFPSRVSDEQYHQLLDAVQEAGMNMLRVWGGGIYEKELFYDLCDEKGILVWQDLMFANSLYPRSKDFHENVQAEVEENVKRLMHHPCIALWCGNNEIEVAWHNWGWQKSFGYSEADSSEIWNNYLYLFKDLIPNTLLSVNKDQIYVSTSPLSNWGSAENFNHSSMHYWGVWHGRESPEAFRDNVGRFMVEYGFQSFPSMETLRKSISEEYLHLDSEVMKNRQKSYIGNDMIDREIRNYLGPARDFEDWVERSQEVQSIAMLIALDAHLYKRPHCMGSLFWQLNDCWPGPSWSVIDYYGNKKPAYYTVKEEFTR